MLTGVFSGGVFPKGRPPFRKIVCPVDFSDASLAALRYALYLAEEADARLTILHVLEWTPEQEPPQFVRFDIQQYRSYLEDDARDKLRKAVPSSARDWCEIKEVVAAGKPYERILAAAKGADLVAMGVRGRGTLDLMLFGSTTNQVVRAAECPVLVLPSPGPPAATRKPRARR